MSLVSAVRQSLSFKVSLKLTVLLVVLTALAAAIIVDGQTEQMKEFTLERARVAASIGARQYGDMFDNAIDSGLVTVADVFDRNYVEIKGYDFKDKPKYHTRYDALTDKSVLVFQDKFLDNQDFQYAVGVDENGYLPTHNTKFQKPVTGDPTKDLAGNRTKRIFADPVGLASAKNTQPSLLQVYERDTGETMWDVSSPILVKGKHWGGFRVAVSMDRIYDRQRSLLLTLVGIFGVFTVVTIGALFLVVRQATRPDRAAHRGGAADRARRGARHAHQARERRRDRAAHEDDRPPPPQHEGGDGAARPLAQRGMPMIRTLHRHVALLALLAVLAPAAARAQAQSTKIGGITPVESLTSQEREMLALATEFARRSTDTLERWLAAKEVTPERLFSFLYYPVASTDPPKFTTDYDTLSDRDILAVEESILSRSSTLIYTVMVDKNGYLPTHNQRYSQPLTGNLASDLVNNRTKRIFNDKTGLAAAQNTAPFLIQNYQRDTGETMADISIPLVVLGKHWGAVRIGYRRVETAAAR